jgi:hypothetical protein
LLGDQNVRERIYDALSTAYQEAAENDLEDDAMLDMMTFEVLDALKEIDPEDLGFEVEEG